MKGRERMDRWSLHVKQWKDCKKCELSQTRQNTVLLRGDVPCDVLFVGEAPGHSEDSIGEPFIGEAGNLLQYDIISEAIPDNITYALTNLIACIPLDDDGNKTEEPDDEYIKACSPRLIDLANFCKPKLIVCVGKHAQQWLNPQHRLRVRIPDDIPRLHIIHPAFILRKTEGKDILISKTIIAIRDAIKQFVNSR